MNIRRNVPLGDFSTMRLGGTATYLADIEQRTDIEPLVRWAIENRIPPLMIGGGSNIIWRDEGFDGLVLVNKIKGFELFEEDELNTYVTIGAGENWDKVVKKTTAAGLSGIEALSLIPGTAGATPIQNVGAYGQEIADTLVSIEAYDLQTQAFTTIPAAECQFAYRSSRFKTTDRDRFFIISITLHLLKKNPEPPFYKALTEYLASQQKKEQYTPDDIRKAVIDIRSSKLPDPAKVANNGSFFANPIISENLLFQLQATYPDIPHWPTDIPGHFKIPAAWLIEQAGFKDVHDKKTGMATWKTQPLVLVNENAKSTADLLDFRNRIVSEIQKKFGILFEQEPELLP